MPKESLPAHMERKHEMLVEVQCDHCSKQMPRKSIEEHQKKNHSLKCLYCRQDVTRSSFEMHVWAKHNEIYREMKKIRKESFENGKRECLKQFYVHCSVCKEKMFKTSLDQHMKEVHPPVLIPFVQPAKQLPLKGVSNLYKHERTADIFFVFEFENSSRVAAHKCILGSDSVVFHRMFYGKRKKMTEVMIGAVSLEAFTIFLASFYTSTMALTRRNVAEIMYLAKKYNAFKCVRACQDFLTSILTTDNVLSVLELSIRNNCEPLRKLCVKKIMQEGHEIIQLDCFYQCSRNVLKQVLSINFKGRDELLLLEVCIEWAKQLCERENVNASQLPNIRLQLGDCFDLIRFNAMTPLQFVQCQSRFAEMFTINELKGITKAIATELNDT